VHKRAHLVRLRETGVLDRLTDATANLTDEQPGPEADVSHADADRCEGDGGHLHPDRTVQRTDPCANAEAKDARHSPGQEEGPVSDDDDAPGTRSGTGFGR